MEFLKKHYEKIILGVVLLAVVGALVWMQMAISKAREEMEMTIGSPPAHKPPPPEDLSKEKAALDVMRNPKPVTLSGDHNLFNPVKWVRNSDGTLSKILKEGAEALTPTAIKPLFTVIAYDRPSSVGYYFSVQHHSGRKSTEFLKVGDRNRNGMFTLRKVDGAPDAPVFGVELAGQTNLVTVTKEQPYQRIDGYSADLKYDPENKTFNNQHVDMTLVFAGDAYKIVAITNNAVRVQANSNQKQTTINWNGVPDTNSTTNSAK